MALDSIKDLAEAAWAAITPEEERAWARRRLAVRRREILLRLDDLPRKMRDAGWPGPVPLGGLAAAFPEDARRLEYARAWLAAPRSLLVHGPAGRGKTWFAAALTSAILAGGDGARRIYWEDWVTEIWRPDVENRPATPGERLLVVDQLNNLKGDGRTEALCALYDKRLGRGVDVYITNRAPADWPKSGWDETVISRLGGLERLRFAGRDRRLKP